MRAEPIQGFLGAKYGLIIDPGEQLDWGDFDRFANRVGALLSDPLTPGEKMYCVKLPGAPFAAYPEKIISAELEKINAQ
jgi:hypothetical protein